MIPHIVKHAASFAVACGTTGVVTYKVHDHISHAIHHIHHQKAKVHHPYHHTALTCPPTQYIYTSAPVGGDFSPGGINQPLDVIPLNGLPTTPTGDTSTGGGGGYGGGFGPAPITGGIGIGGGGGSSGGMGGSGGTTTPPSPPTPPIQTPLPESGTWIMMITGFAAIGLSLRSVVIRKKKVLRDAKKVVL